MKDDRNTKSKVGTGVGAAGGAAAGATIGSTAGPVGTVVGGAVGAAAGALAGQGIADAIDPDAENAYWRDHYSSRHYVDSGAPYTEYEPAYRYGWESRMKYADKTYDDVQSDLERGWDRAKGSSKLGWVKAKNAVRDAWHRVERAIPGDFDHDGR